MLRSSVLLCICMAGQYTALEVPLCEVPQNTPWNLHDLYMVYCVCVRVVNQSVDVWGLTKCGLWCVKGPTWIAVETKQSMDFWEARIASIRFLPTLSDPLVKCFNLQLTWRQTNTIIPPTSFQP